MMLRIRRNRGRLAALLGLVSLATACSPASVGNGSGTAGADFPVTWVDEKHARLPSNLDVLNPHRRNPVELSLR